MIRARIITPEQMIGHYVEIYEALSSLMDVDEREHAGLISQGLCASLFCLFGAEAVRRFNKRIGNAEQCNEQG